MEIFGIIVITIVFLAIVVLSHSSTIKVVDATPEKIANKVRLMLIQDNKTKFVIEHDYLGNPEHEYMRHSLRNKDIMNAICEACPEDYININFAGNKVVINVIEKP